MNTLTRVDVFPTIAFALTLSITCFPTQGYAHDGRDLLLTETAHLPLAGNVYGMMNLNYMDQDNGEWELEPGVFAAVTDWMSLELHGHFARADGGSFHHESTAPAVMFRLTPRGQALSLGLSFEYAIARDSADEDVLSSTLVAGYEAHDWIAAMNLGYAASHGGDHAEADHHAEEGGGHMDGWGYAAGVRHAVTQGHALGLEFQGSLDEGGGEILAGSYNEISDRLTFNLGVGTGYDGGPDWTARAAVVWHLH